jgi:phage gp36-like protein
MGQYINQTDIESRIERAKLVQLTDDDRLNQVNVNVLNAIIADAEGTFNSYARTRYTLPVPGTQQVKNLCLAIAVYTLFARRATTKDGILEVKKQMYDNAIKDLQAISKGQAALDVPAAEETATKPASADEVLSGPSRPATFSDKHLKGY